MDSNLSKPDQPINKRPHFLIYISFWILGVVNFACSPSERATSETKATVVEGKPSSMVYKFTSDTSYYFSTSHEGKFVANTDYLYKPNLEHLPYNLGKWEGEDLYSDDSNILYLRQYDHQETGGAIYLIAVHGNNESLFHTAEVCYIGDGWKIKERKYKAMDLGDETFQVRYALAEKDGYQHLLLYWYLWPDSRRNIMDGMVMFRLSVRVESSLEKAEKDAIDFIQELSNLKMNLKPDAVAETLSPVIPVVKETKAPTDSEWSPYKKKAIAWLKAQAVPNGIVSEPAQDRRNLLVSYRVPEDSPDYRYVFSKASIYDNALGIIAFSMAGEYSLAERIIEAASRVLSPDGDLWFTFNTHNSWPNKHDHTGAIVRSGASAWLGYAITYYLNTRLIENSNLFQENNEAVNFLKIAQSIADKILVRQVSDEKDPRYGFFTGGEGSYSYRWNEDINGVEEYFSPGSIQWASIEHNIDIYFFIRDLARLSGEKKYESAASLLKQSIVKKAWNDEIKQFNRGQRLDGADSAKALDCASWGAMFLKAVGENEKADAALQSISNYSVTQGKHQGFKPYADLLLFDELEINRLFFPDNPDKNWNDVSMIWPEGSLGAIMAYIKMGEKKKAIESLRSIIDLQDQDGGLPYATEYVRYQFSNNTSVAGTAWLVMVIAALEDENIQHLFWGK
jgi:hypothetical protein